MSSGAYYNEFEPFAAQWLRNLIAAGHIPAGDVDDRSIADVRPDDLAGYRQCHFFAGLGGWAYAARLAGWPDDRQIWTGSPPCQPFSVAGKQRGADDDRHLWPHLFRLVAGCRPAVLFCEQVAAAIGKGWLDGVLADLEGIGYTGESAVVPACAVNAPHRRDRLWIVAEHRGRTVDHSERSGLEGLARHGDNAAGRAQQDRSTAEAGGCGNVGNPNELSPSEERQQRGGELGGTGGDSGARDSGDVANTSSGRLGGQGSRQVQQPGRAETFRRGETGDVADGNGIAGGQGRSLDGGSHRGGCAMARPGLGGGDGGSAWASAGWIIGHDGKARRVPVAESGICLLAHGVSARVGKLRGYGNAIVPQIAAEVIGAWMECRP